MSKDGSGRLAAPPGMRGGFGPPPGLEHIDPRAFEQYAAKYFRMQQQQQQQQRGGACPPPFHPGFPGPPPYSMVMPAIPPVTDGPARALQGLMGPPPGMPMMLPPGPPPPGFPFPPFPPGAFPPGYFGPNGPPPPGMAPQSSPQRSPAPRGLPHGHGTPPQTKFMPDAMHRANSGMNLRVPMGRVDTECSRNPAAEASLARRSYPSSPRQQSMSPKRKAPAFSPGRVLARQPDGCGVRRSGSHDFAAPMLGVKQERHDASPPPPNDFNRGEHHGDAEGSDQGYENRKPARSGADEREVKRLRRKQSNRESARRSRLRKQAECEDLTGRIQHLQQINAQLRLEFMNLAGSREELAHHASILENKLNRLSDVRE